MAPGPIKPALDEAATAATSAVFPKTLRSAPGAVEKRGTPRSPSPFALRPAGGGV